MVWVKLWLKTRREKMFLNFRVMMSNIGFGIIIVISSKIKNIYIPRIQKKLSSWREKLLLIEQKMQEKMSLGSFLQEIWKHVVVLTRFWVTWLLS